MFSLEKLKEAFRNLGVAFISLGFGGIILDNASFVDAVFTLVAGLVFLTLGVLDDSER